MNDCHTVVIGAACHGAGIVLGGGDVLVADNGAVVGAEYFDTYRACSGWKDGLQNAVARGLYRDMADRGTITGERSDTYALAPFLYKALIPHHGRFALWTTFLGMRPDNGGFAVSLFDADGRREVRCARVVDMTPACVTNPEFGRTNILSARLTAAVIAPDAAALLEEWRPETGTLRPGRTHDELFFSVPVDPAAGFPAARRKLVAEWNRRREVFFRNNKIAFIAKRFETTLARDDETFAPNHFFFNPARFANPLAAIDAGITFGRKSE